MVMSGQGAGEGEVGGERGMGGDRTGKGRIVVEREGSHACLWLVDRWRERLHSLHFLCHLLQCLLIKLRCWQAAGVKGWLTR